LDVHLAGVSGGIVGGVVGKGFPKPAAGGN
jgi:hypothetical protein